MIRFCVVASILTATEAPKTAVQVLLFTAPRCGAVDQKSTRHVSFPGLSKSVTIAVEGSPEAGEKRHVAEICIFSHDWKKEINSSCLPNREQNSLTGPQCGLDLRTKGGKTYFSTVETLCEGASSTVGTHIRPSKPRYGLGPPMESDSISGFCRLSSKSRGVWLWETKKNPQCKVMVDGRVVNPERERRLSVENAGKGAGEGETIRKAEPLAFIARLSPAAIYCGVAAQQGMMQARLPQRAIVTQKAVEFQQLSAPEKEIKQREFVSHGDDPF
ncbi:hypothetical protein C8R43DRAFT_952786 [Mycena crocata]|nr:hypothetical protein C8R43DRAFT_952786 [Mycena crocata]